MELFKLLGTVAVENTEAVKALKETSVEGKKTESKLSNAFDKIGSAAVKVGKVVATGFGIAATAMGAITTTAVKNYADYEQLVGGVETLFGAGGKSLGEYAASIGQSVSKAKKEYDSLMAAQNTVLRNADAAFKTAGLSANEYMETVTSFSASLIQSLGGDTKKAAEAADQAIVDMSDNANKMGTSMESIQSAYQGFAKQNYTMLDNLKLGYGGTATEMARLINDSGVLGDAMIDLSDKQNIGSALAEVGFAKMVEAIHVVQTEMGITGTTALEASTTISGSISSMKSAWQNFLVGLSDGNQNMDVLVSNLFESVTTVGANLIPRIQQTVKSIVNVVKTNAPKIIAEIQTMMVEMLPTLIETTTNIVKTLKEKFITYSPMVLDGIGNLITGIAGFIQSNLPIVTEKAKEIVSGLGQKIKENLPILISKGLDILTGLSESILSNLPALVATGMDLIKSLAEGFMSALPDLIAKAPLIIINLANAISQSMQTIFMKGFEIVWELIKGIVSAIPDLISNFNNIIKAIFAVWNAINWMNLGKNLIKGISNGIKNLGNSLKNTAKNLFTKLDEMTGNIFKSIGKSIMNPINSAKSLFSTAVSAIKNVAVSVFNALKGSVTSVFNGIKNAIVNPIQTAKTTIKNIVDAIKGFFNFKISFPKIPMPHFSISPSGWSIGDLLKGSIPELSIDWYKKAMDDPMIMNSPTAFGINANGQIMAGGEAGSEVVSGTDTLMNMISSAVAAQNRELTNIVEKIFAFLQAVLPEMQNMQLVMDSGALIGELAPGMDKALGKIAYRNGRGV